MRHDIPAVTQKRPCIKSARDSRVPMTQDDPPRLPVTSLHSLHSLKALHSLHSLKAPDDFTPSSLLFSSLLFSSLLFSSLLFSSLLFSSLHVLDSSFLSLPLYFTLSFLPHAPRASSLPCTPHAHVLLHCVRLCCTLLRCALWCVLCWSVCGRGEKRRGAYNLCLVCARTKKVAPSKGA